MITPILAGVFLLACFAFVFASIKAERSHSSEEIASLRTVIDDLNGSVSLLKRKDDERTHEMGVLASAIVALRKAAKDKKPKTAPKKAVKAKGKPQ